MFQKKRFMHPKGLAESFLIRFDPTALLRLDSCDANKTVYDCRDVQVFGWLAASNSGVKAAVQKTLIMLSFVNF